jgi:putative endonuclease
LAFFVLETIHMNYYIYILYSESLEKYYVGYSSDPWLRLKRHLENSGEKFTGKAADWKLQSVFLVSNNEAEAIRLERFIKKQKSRNLLLKLIDPEFEPEGILAQLVRVPHLRD